MSCTVLVTEHPTWAFFFFKQIHFVKFLTIKDGEMVLRLKNSRILPWKLIGHWSFSLLTRGRYCFHNEGTKLCTVWYSTGTSDTCKSTSLPSPSFFSSCQDKKNKHLSPTETDGKYLTAVSWHVFSWDGKEPIMRQMVQATSHWNESGQLVITTVIAQLISADWHLNAMTLLVADDLYKVM